MEDTQAATSVVFAPSGRLNLMLPYFNRVGSCQTWVLTPPSSRASITTSQVIPSQLVNTPSLVSSILTMKWMPTAVSTSSVTLCMNAPLASPRGPGYHSSLSTHSPRIGPYAAPLAVQQQLRLHPPQHRREQLLGEG